MVELRQLEAEIARSMPPTDTPRVCDAFLALRPRFFEKVFPDNYTSKAVDTKADLNKVEPSPASQNFVEGGDDLKDLTSGFVEPKDEAWTKYSPAYPIVSSQVGPMLRVDNWSADNPDNHANMTLCKGSCLDRKIGDDDADRCASACSDVADCLRSVTGLHTGFVESFADDSPGSAAGRSTISRGHATYSTMDSWSAANSMVTLLAITLIEFKELSVRCRAVTRRNGGNTIIATCMQTLTFPKMKAGREKCLDIENTLLV